MASEMVNVQVKGELHEHMQRQIGPVGNRGYEDAGEYITALIQRDLDERNILKKRLEEALADALSADESDYLEESAADVIKRNHQAMGL